MSVVSVFEISSNNNIVEKLKINNLLNKNNLLITPIKNRYLLSLSKACPSLWEDDLKKISKKGVLNFSTPSLETEIIRVCILNTEKLNDFLSSSCNSFSHFGFNRCGDLGCFLRKTNSNFEFVKLPKENAEFIKQEAEKAFKLWVPYINKEFVCYKRPYTELEKSSLGKYSIKVSDDGKKITWCRNYASAYDENVADYISKALPDEVLRFICITESEVDFDVKLKNGDIIN